MLAVGIDYVIADSRSTGLALLGREVSDLDGITALSRTKGGLEMPAFKTARMALTHLYRRQLFRAYLTSRPPAMHALTRAWLEDKGFPSSLPIIAYKDVRPEILRLHKIRVLIESAPSLITQARADGLHVVTLDAPDNRDLGGMRAGTWDDLHDFLSTLPLDWREKIEKKY